MKRVALVLLFLFVMLSPGFSGEKDSPPADYIGAVAERPALMKGDRWDYAGRDKIIS